MFNIGSIDTILPLYLQVDFEGLTGHIKFSEGGRRLGYSFGVMQSSVHSVRVKVGEWSPSRGFTSIPPKYTRPGLITRIQRNRTYVVTTILVR
jgi:hypothetical protein